MKFKEGGAAGPHPKGGEGLEALLMVIGGAVAIMTLVKVSLECYRLLQEIKQKNKSTHTRTKV